MCEIRYLDKAAFISYKSCMVLGINANVFSGLTLQDGLQTCSQLGLGAIELKTPGFPKNALINIDALLSDSGEISKLEEQLKKHGLFLSGLSCAGNHVHPQKDIREPFQDLFKRTIVLAEKMGIERVITFSGCPGDCPSSLYPNWVTCPWPDDFLKVLDYQWNEVMLPYWESTAKFANDRGVKICLEMHPGFCVYNPESFLKLHRAGENIGLNFDPSHLFWQGIDPVEAIAAVGKSIFHVHAKDTFVDRSNVRLNGVLDTKHYGNVAQRAWTFRTAGYGNSIETWKKIISSLRTAGYDYVLSIEHEDCMMSRSEGLAKAVSFMKEVMIKEQAAEMWWA